MNTLLERLETVEKRYDEWQVIVDKIKRLNGDN